MTAKVGGFRPFQPIEPRNDIPRDNAASQAQIAKEAADLASKLSSALENAKPGIEKVKSTSAKVSGAQKNIVLVVENPPKTIEKKAIRFRTRYLIKALDALSYVPMAVEFFAKAPVIKETAAIPGLCVDVFLTGYDLYKKAKSSNRHHKWIKKLEPEHPQLNPQEVHDNFNILVKSVIKTSGKNLIQMREELGRWGVDIDKYKETKAISTPAELIHQLENKKFLKKIFPDYAHKAASIAGAKRLLKKSEDRFNQKIEEKRVEFKFLIKGLNGPFEEVKRTLKSKGIDVDAIPGGRSIRTTLELKTKLADAAFEETLFKPMLKEYARPYAERALARSTLLNNPLKALSLMKQKSEKVFFNFNLFQSKYNFAVTLISSVALVALKVMIVVGLISIPALVGTGIGIGAAALMLGAVGLGLFILYKYKPESFKAMIKGKNLWLMEKRMSSSFHHWRLDKKRAKSQAYHEALQVYSAHALKNPDLLPKEFKSAKARYLNKRIEKSKQQHAGDVVKLKYIDDMMFKQMNEYRAKKSKSIRISKSINTRQIL